MDARQLAIQNAVAAVRAADPARAQPKRDPLMPPGAHSGLICEVHPSFELPEGGRVHSQKVFVRALVLESTNPLIPADGLVTVTIFDLARIPQYAKQASDADRFALFVARLTGLTDVAEVVLQLLTQPQDQIMRGMTFSANATFSKANSKIDYREVAYGAQEYTVVVGANATIKNRWIDVDWRPGEPQDDAALASARAFLDEHYPIRQEEEREQKQVARAAAAAVPPPAAAGGASIMSRFRK
jgi:hypothetical protein